MVRRNFLLSNVMTEFKRVNPHLVLNRVIEMAKRIEANRLKLLKEAFAQDHCDALFRLMQLIAGQSKQAIKRVL